MMGRRNITTLRKLPMMSANANTTAMKTPGDWIKSSVIFVSDVYAEA
jgi:hypothetical protein